MNYWASLLQTGQISPIGSSTPSSTPRSSARSVEPVARLYLAYFGRDPDFAGLMFWANQLRSRFPLQVRLDSFATSAEFRSATARCPTPPSSTSSTATCWAERADAAGIAYWVGQLAGGALNRGGVMVNFSESAEYREPPGPAPTSSPPISGSCGAAPTPPA